MVSLIACEFMWPEFYICRSIRNKCRVVLFRLLWLPQSYANSCAATRCTRTNFSLHFYLGSLFPVLYLHNVNQFALIACNFRWPEFCRYRCMRNKCCVCLKVWLFVLSTPQLRYCCGCFGHPNLAQFVVLIRAAHERMFQYCFTPLRCTRINLPP